MKQLLLGLVLGAALATAAGTLADSMIWGSDGRVYFKQEMPNPYQAPLLWEQPGRGRLGQPHEVPITVPGGRPC